MSSNSLKQWKDRRQHRRISIRLKATLVTKDHSFDCFTKNISEGGILLDCDLPLHMRDTEVKVFLHSPDQLQKIEFKAQIVKDKIEFKHMQFTVTTELGLEHLKYWLEQALFLTEYKKAI